MHCPTLRKPNSPAARRIGRKKTSPGFGFIIIKSKFGASCPYRMFYPEPFGFAQDRLVEGLLDPS